METKNIMIVGVGGQGTLLASKLLGRILLENGYDVKVSEVHGMSQRGGSVVTYVRYGEKVYSPIIDKGEADFVLSFELLEAARWAEYLKEGGVLLTNTQKVNPMPVITGAAEYPKALEKKLAALPIRLDAMDALGLDGENRLDIVLMQLVKLVRDGEVVRMSKRTGKAISLTDLLDEIPVDACRYFFNAKPDTQMDFDLGLAVREDSENPVYYIQYAYARICSLLKTMADEGRSVPAADKADLSLLSGEQERALIKELANFSEEIRMAARDYDPSYINRYLMRLAGAFHRFYNACRIKGEADDVADARLLLAAATRQVLANGLTILGLSKPEKM